MNTKCGNFTKGMESKQDMDSVSSPLLSDIDHGDNHCTESKGKYAVFTDNDENKDDEEEEYVHVDGTNPLLSDEENMAKDGVGIEIPTNGGDADVDDHDEDEDEEYDDDMIFDD